MQVTVKLTRWAYGGRPPGTVMTLNKPVADILLGNGSAVVVDAEESKVVHRRPRNKALSAAAS